ncbi:MULTISPECIES: pseudouridine synthase [Methylorubrum]|uniref:pseudouridine synthase n=1 Tax=Methylorubrum TaxID=2282523 RepID=UPI001619FA71|nr:MULTISPECIES: pseudouridine synthase [Methylorubrum]MBI1692177.1 rRNA pseudouridine synthase [Methylorubrum sp. DB1722]
MPSPQPGSQKRARGTVAVHSGPPLVSLPRVLSKFGFCSRRLAQAMIESGRVRVDGRVVRHAGLRIDPKRAAICVDGRPVVSAAKVYVLLNKPRGLLTTYDDPLGRRTVYDCLNGHDLPFLGPVGRLDCASEGLLLMTNDTRWAHHLLDPASNVEKVYHVQIDGRPDDALLSNLRDGLIDDGERLAARSVTVLRLGERNAWLEVVLTEGRNRQIRRMMALSGVNVLRLVRVAVGSLRLGDVAKGKFRHLTAAERAALAAGPSADGGLRASAAGRAAGPAGTGSAKVGRPTEERQILRS